MIELDDKPRRAANRNRLSSLRNISSVGEVKLPIMK
jgi:hypothetical protein